MVAAAILIGAPGAGKSSVWEAVTTLLEIEGLEFGAIESEQLALDSPLLGASDWTRQLEAVLALQRRGGRSRFLITATVEDSKQLRAVAEAAHADRTFVVCLTAPPEVVAARVADREPDRWPGKPRLIAHARELARSVPALDGIDLSIDTNNRDPEEVAVEVRNEMRARGLLD